MAASVQCRQQERNFGTVMENRKDDDLALFHELENRSIEKNEFLLHESNDFGDHLDVATKQDRCSIFKTAITVPQRRTGVDAFLNSENDKTDYDWLLTPPDTPLFPSLEMEQNHNVVNQIAVSNGHATAPESKHAKPQTQPAPKNNETSKPLIPSTSSNRRPTPTSSRPATPTSRPTRPSTPTLRPTLPATTKPARSSTPTPRPTLPSSTKIARSSTPTSRASVPSITKPNRPSTPTSRASLPSTTKPNRPSTPTSRASRPSTPTLRASLPSTTKPNRSSTPTSRPALRSSTPTNSSSGPKVVKNPGPSRGSSPTVRSRPSKDTPSARSSSNGRTRQPSNGFSVLAMSRGHSMNGDDVNPVLMGTKMVERVVNMRKLVPPKQDDYVSNNSSGRTMSSQENLGRTLSKTSLDMAIRHMDITKRIPGNLRPLVTNIPASSVYSVRSGSTKGKTVTSSDSPLATSSIASSEPSVNNGSTCLDDIEAEENNFRNGREKSSPAA